MTPIAAHLDGDDLSALARTCVAMRRLCDGPQGRVWWRDACVRLLGKTHCAVHLRAWGGPDGGYDDARLWRKLYRHASFPVSFSWHAGLGGSLWEGVHDKDEAARREALRRAEARLGTLEEYDEDLDWVERDDLEDLVRHRRPDPAEVRSSESRRRRVGPVGGGAAAVDRSRAQRAHLDADR